MTATAASIERGASGQGDRASTDKLESAATRAADDCGVALEVGTARASTEVARSEWVDWSGRTYGACERRTAGPTKRIAAATAESLDALWRRREEVEHRAVGVG